MRVWLHLDIPCPSPMSFLSLRMASTLLPTSQQLALRRTRSDFVPFHLSCSPAVQRAGSLVPTLPFHSGVDSRVEACRTDQRPTTVVAHDVEGSTADLWRSGSMTEPKNGEEVVRKFNLLRQEVQQVRRTRGSKGDDRALAHVGESSVLRCAKEDAVESTPIWCSTGKRTHGRCLFDVDES